MYKKHNQIQLKTFSITKGRREPRWAQGLSCQISE